MIKKGSHLDGVEPINEILINNLEIINILQNKIKNTNLNYIKHFIKNASVSDKSGYSGNSVLIIEKKRGNLQLKYQKMVIYMRNLLPIIISIKMV